MNPHQNSKLSQRQKEQAAAKFNVAHVAQNHSAMEFQNPEEMLRFDAGQVEVPDRVAERLQESIRKEPPRPKSWWARLFGGK